MPREQQPIQPSVVRCENGQYSAECPACGEFIDVDAIEHDLGVEEGTGRRLGHHTEPDMGKLEAHYRSKHLSG